MNDLISIQSQLDSLREEVSKSNDDTSNLRSLYESEKDACSELKLKLEKETREKNEVKELLAIEKKERNLVDELDEKHSKLKIDMGKLKARYDKTLTELTFRRESQESLEALTRRKEKEISDMSESHKVMLNEREQLFNDEIQKWKDNLKSLEEEYKSEN